MFSSAEQVTPFKSPQTTIAADLLAIQGWKPEARPTARTHP